MKWKEMTLAEKFVHFKAIYGLASAQTAFFMGLLNISLLLQIMTWIALYFPDLRPALIFLIPGGTILYIVIHLYVGMWLERKKLPHKQIDWGAIRNPQMQKIINNQKLIFKNQQIITEKLRRII